MAKRTIAWLLPVAMITLLGAGCFQKSAEKAAEDNLKKANINADVDIDNNTVTVNTNSGSWQMGESVSLPDGFPSDVYVIDGTITSAIKMTASSGYTVAINTNETVASAKAKYDTEVAADGWTIASTGIYEGSGVIIANKGERSLSVGINLGDDGKATVALSTLTNTTETTNSAE